MNAQETVEQTEREARAEMVRADHYARLDDDIPTGPSTEHLAPDNDPYGWVAGVEAAHPDFVENSIGEQVPVRPQHVVIWQHALQEPDRYDYAIAKVLPNGVLLVTPRGSDVPLKGYAPGVWLTFEHVGEEYHIKPQRPAIARMHDDRPVQTTNYAAQERAAAVEMLAEHTQDPALLALARTITDPTRRIPPTLEQDADDDTQSIPVVHTEQVGGGVERPKARGARWVADPTDRKGRPVIVDADGVKLGFWATLRKAFVADPDDDLI